MQIVRDGKGDPTLIRMRLPDNWHVHFRQGLLLVFLVTFFIKYGWRMRLVAMPNTQPANLTGKMAREYADEIERVAHGIPGGEKMVAVATMQITEATTGNMIRDAFANRVRVFKVYPRYVTTHSENGVVDYTLIYPALAVVEALGGVAEFHSEHPSYSIIGRLKEEMFIFILDDIRQHFPKLRISVEHVSSKVMIQWVKVQPDNVGASLAIQHMTVTSDDLNGYSQRSGGLLCVHDGGFKPGAKDPEDREAIIDAATSGNPKFWYGGDDAAHLKSKKECARPACGAWNTIAALSMLISLFIKRGCLERLEAFLSEFGARFYGYPINEETLSVARVEWVVPKEVPVPELNDSIVPFYAGETMDWEVVPSKAPDFRRKIQ